MDYWPIKVTWTRYPLILRSRLFHILTYNPVLVRQSSNTRSAMHECFSSCCVRTIESLAFAKQIAADMKPLDKMVIFNGRLCGFYPFVRTAKDNGISFYCFEMPDSGSGAFVSEGLLFMTQKSCRVSCISSMSRRNQATKKFWNMRDAGSAGA